MNEALSLAKVLWNYNVLDQDVQKADCIIALGNSDIRTAQAAASLYSNGYADILVTTGGFGRLTRDLFNKPEAELFADEAMRLGVPADRILVEDASTNTFDNIRFTKMLLAEKEIHPKSLLIVTKPYMERRAYTTACSVWKDVQITVASAPLDFETYPDDSISQELLINMVVGDTQRLMIFSKSGHIARQYFPDEVVDAYVRLIDLGYSEQVIPEENIPNLLNAVTAGGTA